MLDADQCTIDHEHEIGELKSELRNLLYDFKSGIPLSRPVELLQMAEKVANQIESKTEKDIDKWAEDLSNEISKLSD